MINRRQQGSGQSAGHAAKTISLSCHGPTHANAPKSLNDLPQPRSKKTKQKTDPPLQGERKETLADKREACHLTADGAYIIL